MGKTEERQTAKNRGGAVVSRCHPQPNPAQPCPPRLGKPNESPMAVAEWPGWGGQQKNACLCLPSEYHNLILVLKWHHNFKGHGPILEAMMKGGQNKCLGQPSKSALDMARPPWRVTFFTHRWQNLMCDPMKWSILKFGCPFFHWKSLVANFVDISKVFVLFWSKMIKNPAARPGLLAGTRCSSKRSLP